MLGNIGQVVSTALQSLQPTQAAIQMEMDAYQRDKNPEHLLRVISMQQAIIEHRGSMLGFTTQVGSILEGAVKALDPKTPGPKVTEGVMQAIQNMVNQVGPPATPATLTPAVVDQLQVQQMLQKQQALLQQITSLMKQQHDMAKSAIQNIR